METKAKEKQYTIYFKDVLGLLPRLPVKQHCTFEKAFRFLCEYLGFDLDNVDVISNAPFTEEVVTKGAIVIGLVIVTFEEE